jgi:hypothetical protein
MRPKTPRLLLGAIPAEKSTTPPRWRRTYEKISRRSFSEEESNVSFSFLFRLRFAVKRSAFVELQMAWRLRFLSMI